MKFKIGDIIAVVYFAAFVCLVFFFPWDYGTDVSIDVSKLSVSSSSGLHWVGFSTNGIKCFGRVVGHFPYISGFLKVGLLATLGEMIKVRGKTGSWKTPDLIAKLSTRSWAPRCGRSRSKTKPRRRSGRASPLPSGPTSSSASR